MLRSIATLAGAIIIVSSASAEPKFVNRTGDVIHEYTGGWEHFVGGGIAVFDCDDDHQPEIFLAGGTSHSKLLRNRTNRQDGKIRFDIDTGQEVALLGVTGAYPIHTNDDAFIDLIVLRVGHNLLLEGRGNCVFDANNQRMPLNHEGWTTAFSATWEAGHQWPTLAFGNYVDRTHPEGPFGACDANTLMRSNDGQYTTQTTLTPGHCALSMLFSDWNRNGVQDLRISNDRHYYVSGGQEQLWRFGDGPPRLYTKSDGWIDYKIWGMGIASRDIDFDGIQEIYLTSMGDQKLHKLASGARGPTYLDADYDRGITAHRPYNGVDGRASTGWHAAFGDIQNDGLDDIFIAKGNVDQMMSAAMKDPNNLLIQGNDGRFTETGQSAGIASDARSRGAALVDLNLDGRLDLVVNNRRANVEVYQNVSANTGNWLSIKLTQDPINRDAIGAWIELSVGERVYHREIVIGGGHAGGSSVSEHFGLGAHTKGALRVTWPDRIQSNWVDLKSNRNYRIKRADAELLVETY